MHLDLKRLWDAIPVERGPTGEATTKTPKTDDEDCPPCATAVAGGHLLQVCQIYRDENRGLGIECNDLADEFTAGKVTVGELADMVKERVKSKSPRNAHRKVDKAVNEMLEVFRESDPRIIESRHDEAEYQRIRKEGGVGA